ncbi:D-lactate dehydrogenase [Desulfuromusa kysingii]|uniref:D-lactate dehydrogenase (cytochrome) n=1 Tax=Desulfuromusa kysingii TaxID=37625 RepID=A0A1H4C1N0_9BACT|nr:FAD-binding and (Fe-S)-binding domain-containing protein [Desulfuromusa kysingii]SEA54288.1 D-lactate dehydrogenase [Desulfuromusa kysingii]
MLAKDYQSFHDAISKSIAKQNIITDPLLTVAFGTDASFYRMIPQIVVNVETEEEVQIILQEASRRQLAVTFRAAGTSLSGQAITDSILVRLGKGWQNYKIFDKARKIQLQPGIIGSQANRFLAEFGKKIGPDPASIDSAKIGGILANNASGMCCGVAENSYQTLDSLRMILADGTVVDTADDTSRAQFKRSHAHILEGLTTLRHNVLSDQNLTDRIRYKYKIKNTTGYSLNALIDFKDPFAIMQQLMVGSEGTLGFISEVIYKTVIEHKHKASALILFPDVPTACSAVPLLRDGLPVAAAELMDRAGLASVEHEPGMPDYLAGLGETVTALLVETRANSASQLRKQIQQIQASLAKIKTIGSIEFTDDPLKYKVYWNIRKGLFPAVGAVRDTGKTVIIEDVAFPAQHLAAAALDLQSLFKKYQYHEAIIFGHALEGNLHFVFTQDFSITDEVIRYRNFMDEVVTMVVEKYDGSLKAEHGTGRNMAPFVEKEWGTAAYQLMRQIKSLFDPDGLLNPGVIINEDAEAHIKNLKPLPATHELVDKCIECGFCEPVCPSRNLSFTPRQRIVSRREISRQMTANASSSEVGALLKSYQYPGQETCAADGLCGTKCPVGIDTGKMVKALREEANGELANLVADWVARNFKGVARTINTTLVAVDKVHQLTGTAFMEQASSTARSLSANKLPLWNREMPSGVKKIQPEKVNPENPLQVVYFPACPSRCMSGPARGETEVEDLPQKTVSLLKKAGYQILYPENLEALCCGQAFESKGFYKQAAEKSEQLNRALLSVSAEGEIPVLCDTSPCLLRMKENLDPKLKLYEPIEFVLDYLLDKLNFTPIDAKVALHITCSSRKMGLDQQLKILAQSCATEVVIPEDIYCCGFAGDRGFNYPELNATALEDLKRQVKGCDAGYSTSKTCEIGLSVHGNIPYRSILYLVDAATTARRKNKETAVNNTL